LIGFASLGSGSRGNGTLVRIGAKLIMVDCGFPLKQTEYRLLRAGVRPGDLDAILVTHEHSDHSAGIAALAYKYAIPVYGSFGTLRALAPDLAGTPVDSHTPFDLLGVRVIPVIVPHDTREPVQFVLQHAGVRIGVLSDLGHITPHVVDSYSNLDGLLMESNHDAGMLANGRYPPHLKRRVGGNLGHLNNDQARDFLQTIGHAGLNVVIGHVSEQNNHPDRLKRVFDPLIDQVGTLAYATQADGFDWVEIEPVSCAADRVNSAALQI
jgi:phosphoribosyl 1,2-cyclic phosphodiesterase